MFFIEIHQEQITQRLVILPYIIILQEQVMWLMDLVLCIAIPQGIVI